MIFDLKKLVSIFLLLAGVAGSFALIFSNSGQPAGGSASLAQTASDSTHNNQIPKNAFVEPVPTQTSGTMVSDVSSVQQIPASQKTDSNNLTQKFVDQLSAEFFDNNPNGPLADSSGEQIVNLPTEDRLAQLIQETALSSSGEFQNTAAVRTTSNYRRDDLIAYLDSVNAIVGKNINTSFQKIISGEPDAQTIAAIETTLSVVSTRLANLSAPQPFAPFHRALLNFFANQEMIFRIISGYENDPMKAVIAISAAEGTLDRDLQILDKALRATDFQKIIADAGASNRWSSLVLNIAGIQTAHALGWSIVFDPHALAQLIKTHATEIKKWLYETALSIVINQTLNRLQNQVVDWINGGGKPKFVTDWKGFLADAGSNAAGMAIGRIVPGLCTGFGPLVQLALQPVPNIYDTTQCTLDQVVQNVQYFYDNFQYGGWVAYGASLQPQNNFYGSLIMASDIANEEAAAAREAARNEGIASQGFLGVKTCPVGTTKTDNNMCSDGSSPQIGTPGNAVGVSLANALDWKPNRIISAKRIGEVLGAILDAAIYKLTTAGIGALSSIGSSDNTNFSDSQLLDIGGQSIGAPAGTANPADINSIRAGIIDSASTQIGELESSKDAVRQYAARCGTSATGGNDADSLINQLESIKTQAAGASDIGALETLNTQLDGLVDTISQIIGTAGELAGQDCPAQSSP